MQMLQMSQMFQLCRRNPADDPVKTDAQHNDPLGEPSSKALLEHVSFQEHETDAASLKHLKHLKPKMTARSSQSVRCQQSLMLASLECMHWVLAKFSRRPSRACFR